MVGRARRVGDQLARPPPPRPRQVGPGPSSPRRSSAPPLFRRPRPSPARCPARSSAARRRRSSWGVGSCDRRTARRRRRERRVSCRRGGSRRRRATGSAKPTSAVMPLHPAWPAPRPHADWPRRSGALGRDPRLGSRDTHSSGKIASSAPSAARSATRRSLPRCLDVADGGVDLGEGYAHRSLPERATAKYRAGTRAQIRTDQRSGYGARPRPFSPIGAIVNAPHRSWN